MEEKGFLFYNLALIHFSLAYLQEHPLFLGEGGAFDLMS